MLRGSVIFIVLVVCAVVGAEIVRILADKGWRAPSLEGVSFLLVGLVLGGRGLGLFPDDLLVSLRVVVLFGLAWIGLVFGVEMDLASIRRVTPRLRSIAVAAPTLMAATVTAAAVLVGMPASVALATAAITAASSPTLLESAIRGRAVGGTATVRVVKLVLAFAGVPAVAAMAVATSLASPLVAAPDAAVGGAELLIVVVAMGAVVGYVLVMLVRGVRDHMMLLTLTLGGMCALAGATSVVGVTALPAAACAGAVIVNRMVFPHRMLRAAHSLERPLLVALLVLVGASWSGGAFSWAVFALMTGVRAAAAAAAGWWVARAVGEPGSRTVRRDLGVGLLPQGALALGLLVATVSFLPQVPGYLEAVVAALVVNNLAGAWWYRARLSRAGGAETAP